MPFNRGENVGPYRVAEPLGQGGMASVYKAYHPALDRFVAIKVLHPAFLEDPNFLARFQREARVVAKLEHPNIVSIYDFAEHEGQPYLVMKFIEGQTLKSVLRHRTLTLQEGLRIIEPVGEALSYAHDQGILHRDIKPSNVLLGADEGIYLADFGLARIAQAGESTLSGDMLLGTPQYISPEQAKGEEHLDEGTDIYSLGVVLYELAVGRVPFNADTPFSIIHDHIYTPLPMPSQVNPNVPEAVERVLLKSLAKAREDRFATVDDLVTAYSGAIQGTETFRPELAPVVPASQEAESVGDLPPEDEITTAASRRWWWMAGGALLACLCLLAFALAVRNQRDGFRAEAATATALAADTRPTSAPLPTRQIEDPQVQAARTAVAEDPDNPEAHLDLADSLLGAGFERLAVPQYLTAADLYLAEGAHVEAAASLVDAFQLAGDADRSEPRLRGMMMQALFLSADSPQEAAPLLAIVEEEAPGWDALPTLSSRLALYDGRLEEALPRLEEAVEERPNDPFLKSVLAEAYLLDGRPEDARQLAEEARRHPGAPEWLVHHLTEIVERTAGA